MNSLLATLFLSTLAAHVPGDLEALRDEHGRALAAIGRAAIDDQLFNDAERLLEQALVWSPQVHGIEAYIDSLDTLRRVRIKDPAREEYRAFLDSKEYTKARAALRESEASIKKATGSGAVDIATAASLAEDEALVEEALHLALDMGLDESALKRIVGSKRASATLEAWEDSRGLQQLELGERVAGDPLALEDLEGKVVLWRNFSL